MFNKSFSIFGSLLLYFESMAITHLIYLNLLKFLWLCSKSLAGELSVLQLIFFFLVTVFQFILTYEKIRFLCILSSFLNLK